jgi:hypothetical protein
MTFIAYLFGDVRVLGWKIRRRVLEFDNSVMLHNTNFPTHGLRRLGYFTEQSSCDPVVRSIDFDDIYLVLKLLAVNMFPLHGNLSIRINIGSRN